jgi:uncharacterized membrane protein YbhN (UPF0104 family)
MSDTVRAMSNARRRRQRTALSAIVSVISLAGCAWWASRQQAPTIPTSAGALSWLALALATYAVIMVARGARWHAILRHAGVEHRTADAYGLTTVGYMGNAVLPARGGEILRIVLLGQRSPARHAEILGTIVPERLLDAGTLVVLFAALTFAGADGLPAGNGPAIAALAALVVGFVALVAYWRLRIAGRFQRFADRARPFIRASRLLLDREGAALAALTLAIWLVEGLVLTFVALALDIHIGIGGAVAAVVFASIAAIVPAGPGYIGTFDAAALFAFHALDVTGGTAVSLLLLYRAIVFVPVTVTGLVLVVARYGGLGMLRRRGRPEPEPEPERPAGHTEG